MHLLAPNSKELIISGSQQGYFAHVDFDTICKLAEQKVDIMIEMKAAQVPYYACLADYRCRIPLDAYKMIYRWVEEDGFGGLQLRDYLSRIFHGKSEVQDSADAQR